ncbi:MAG: translation initiation factor IF-3, partial [Desulfobacterales bacterium]|nr:translation initiation factor IF-3 [Desulfobacterales bacterium]
ISAANENLLDLVEISPNASPPVCKIMDYGRYKYEMTKKQQETKKKQASFQVKEIKLRPKTGENDFLTKLGHVRKFLQKKDKVKVTVQFRGREIALTTQAKELLEKIAEQTSDIAAVEQQIKMEGRTMILVLTPK